jgi:hypothetical protein
MAPASKVVRAISVLERNCFGAHVERGCREYRIVEVVYEVGMVVEKPS